MRRILTIVAATATLVSVSAPSVSAQQGADFLRDKVFRALRECSLDSNVVGGLSMAQVAGITLTASSANESEKCQKIQAITIGD